MQEVPLHESKIGIWSRMSTDRIIGPSFFEDKINSERYMEQILPTLRYMEQILPTFRVANI
jgi:hypothetical protein